MSSYTKLHICNKCITIGNTFPNVRIITHMPRRAMQRTYSDASCLELSCVVWVVYVSSTPPKEIFDFPHSKFTFLQNLSIIHEYFQTNILKGWMNQWHLFEAASDSDSLERHLGWILRTCVSWWVHVSSFIDIFKIIF